MKSPNGRETWIACQDEWFGDIRPTNLGKLLENGGAWVSLRDGKFAWVLARREIYVLAPCSSGTISGFLSVPRLMLNEKHVVLCMCSREDVVRKALLEAGCADPAMSGSTNGVPDGWVLFRDVCPTNAIEHEDRAGILNILRPVREVEILLRGGIRLSHSTWLNDHPPQIDLRGKAGDDIEVMIDETPATAGYDGHYTASGWDLSGIHTVFCGGVTRTYELADGLQEWSAFNGFSFGRSHGRGADFSVGICGPIVAPTAAGQEVSLVPSANSCLLGAIPGQIAVSRQPLEVRALEHLAIAGFRAVWSLPANPLRSSTSATCIQLLPSVNVDGDGTPVRMPCQELLRWCRAILDASRRRLRIMPDEPEAKKLWKQYKRTARDLWKQMK